MMRVFTPAALYWGLVETLPHAITILLYVATDYFTLGSSNEKRRNNQLTHS
jgi:hypothetical protein